MSTITAWLENLGLAKYQEVFVENEVDFEVLPELTEADLEKLSIPLGPRKRIIRAIREIATGRQEAATDTATSNSSQVLNPAAAERRQLTVMFIDLVGSTALSATLDPEDLNTVLRRYQNTVAGEITRFRGYPAKYMGDGVLAYFGWPQAQEDSVGHALRAALAILEAMSNLNSEPDLSPENDLSVRIGIATGLVVVGELIGEGISEEHNVVGETPNLAARLQALAQPGGIVISQVTRDLASNDFVYRDLGLHTLKGISRETRAWALSGQREVQDASFTRVDHGLLVGRCRELETLNHCWQQACNGEHQSVLLCGEPGIGKSHLIEAIAADSQTQAYNRVILRCSQYHINSAYFPLLQHIRHRLDVQQEDNNKQKIECLQRILADCQHLPENSVELLAGLLSIVISDLEKAGSAASPGQRKQQTLDLLISLIHDSAKHGPVLWVWEDLHWADPSTLELIGLLLEKSAGIPILHIFTYRPDFSPPWPQYDHVRLLDLKRLDAADVNTIIDHYADGKGLPADVVSYISDKTDGVPLFVAELTKALLQSGVLHLHGDRYQLTGSLDAITIPVTLQDSLMARLDRQPSVRRIAQIGAVLGRDFPYLILQAIAQVDEETLQHHLTHLVEDELLDQRELPPKAIYSFKHALIQEIAYQSLLRRTRQQYHQRAAELLKERFPELSTNEPELLAFHFTEAGQIPEAVNYWQLAGQKATEKSAFQEAFEHLKTGLQLLQTLPADAARDALELPLQTAFGAVAIVIKGQAAPEAETAYSRARVLCQEHGNTRDLVPILIGLWRLYNNRQNFPVSRQLAEQLLDLAQQNQDTLLQVTAHCFLGTTLMFSGEFPLARQQLEEGLSHYANLQSNIPRSQSAQDPGLICHTHLAMTLWLLGYPNQALAHLRQGLALAERLGQPYSRAFALVDGSIVRYFRGEIDDFQDFARRCVEISSEHRFTHWLGISTVFYGASLAMRGECETGLATMSQGLQDYRTAGAGLIVPFMHTRIADAYQRMGNTEAGLAALEEGLEIIEKTNECWWHPELLRGRGELLLSGAAQHNPGAIPDEVESCFQQALDIARRLQAKSLELRAATSLAQLWRDQGKKSQARELLDPVYDWFSEGFDTADLQEAGDLLAELRQPAR